MRPRPCGACQGARLRPEAIAVRVHDSRISDITVLSVEQAERFFVDLSLDDFELRVAGKILQELRVRLRFLRSVGLQYLTLDRAAATLSGGEGQRIRLATQIGSGLVGVLYILDEPSIGLHQRDNQRLLESLQRLRDLNNTVLVVEHDRDTINAADYVVDLGPGAGEHGGYVVAAGTPDEVRRQCKSLTGQYLSGKLTIPVPAKRRKPGRHRLALRKATANNLKDLEVTIPLGVFVCVTGVSGSGKSTLVMDILYKALARRLYRTRERPGAFGALKGMEHLDKAIDIDQSPIGRTPRSNPATYTGLFDTIRALFTQVPEARVRGYKPGRFSFNVKGGRCEACQGHGTLKIEMHFLPDVYVTCDICKGRRFNRDTLEIRYRDKTVADVLDFTVDEAAAFFANVPMLTPKLNTLQEVGLGYIRLGQAATTLSGGEAQRVKLSRELSKRSTGRTLYILDEPTTGLHFADIQRLIEVLQRLVAGGNTVLVIEHNLDVIKTADFIIDLGPEGGDGGGRLVAAGTPEAVAEVEASYTGSFPARGSAGWAVSAASSCSLRTTARATTAGRCSREGQRCRVRWSPACRGSPTPRCGCTEPDAPTPACTPWARWRISIRSRASPPRRWCAGSTACCRTISPCAAPSTLRRVFTPATTPRGRRTSTRYTATRSAPPCTLRTPGTCPRASTWQPCAKPPGRCRAGTIFPPSGAPRGPTRDGRCVSCTGCRCGSGRPVSSLCSAPTASCTTWRAASPAPWSPSDAAPCRLRRLRRCCAPAAGPRRHLRRLPAGSFWRTCPTGRSGRSRQCLAS